MRLKYSRTFKKDFKKLSSKMKVQLSTRIEIFKNNSNNIILNNHAVHHPYKNARSINITGNLRALYEKSEDTIIFISELY